MEKKTKQKKQNRSSKMMRMFQFAGGFVDEDIETEGMMDEEYLILESQLEQMHGQDKILDTDFFNGKSLIEQQFGFFFCFFFHFFSPSNLNDDF